MATYPVVNTKTGEQKEVVMSVMEWDKWKEENPDWTRDYSDPSTVPGVGFSWLDIPSEILESGDAIRVEAYADTGNGLEAVSPSVFADVLAATTGNGRDGVQLDVRDYGTISAAEVIKFRK